MLNDVDATLAELLVKRTPLDPAQVAVSFECPTREWSARVLKPTVNLYLFDVRQNTTFGAKSGQGATPRPPTYMDVSYFVTAWASSVADEHRLLWSVTMTLLKNATIPPDLLQGALQKFGPPVQTTTAKWDGVLKKPGELWESLDNVLKPGLTYTATLSVVVQPPPPKPAPVLTKMIVTSNTMRAQKEPLVAIGGVVRARRPDDADAETPIRVISDAEVTFPRLGITVRSDGDGRYLVRKIPQGTHQVRVVTDSGATSEAEITIPAPNYNLEV